MQFQPGQALTAAELNTAFAGKQDVGTGGNGGTINLDSPTFTGVPQVPTAPVGTNTQQISSTAFANAAAAAAASAAVTTAVAPLAPKASPAFSGIPTAPTAPVGTNTAQLATTAHAFAAAAAAAASKAPSVSPTFTGVPLAPTAAPLTNNQQIASTGYTDAAVAVLKAYVDGLFAARTASASGSTIPTATQLIDSNFNVWTVVGGVIYMNGSLAGTTSNVTLLLYYNGVIYQENSSGNWYQWLGTSWSSILSSGDPRTSTGTGSSIPIPFYSVNAHYVQGGVYSSIPIATQAALAKSIGAQTMRQDMYNATDAATMANTVIPQATAAGIQICPCIIPDLVAGSPTAAQLYTSSYTLGAACANKLAGLIPFLEIGNEYDIAALRAAGNLGTDGNLASQYDQSTMALAMAAMRGVIDGWRSVDTTTPLGVNCTYIHFAFLTMMVNGTLPNGATAPNGNIPFDILTWHHYSTGGNMDSVFGVSGTYNVFNSIEAITSKPYYFTETGSGDATVANSTTVTWMNYNYALMVARPKCIGLSYYELYNYEDDNGNVIPANNTSTSSGYGLYAINGSTPTAKSVATAFKAFIAANPK